MLEFTILGLVAIASGIVGAILACFGIAILARRAQIKAREKDYGDWGHH